MQIRWEVFKFMSSTWSNIKRKQKKPPFALHVISFLTGRNCGDVMEVCFVKLTVRVWIQWEVFEFMPNLIAHFILANLSTEWDIVEIWKSRNHFSEKNKTSRRCKRKHPCDLISVLEKRLRCWRSAVWFSLLWAVWLKERLLVSSPEDKAPGAGKPKTAKLSQCDL